MSLTWFEGIQLLIAIILFIIAIKINDRINEDYDRQIEEENAEDGYYDEEDV